MDFTHFTSHPCKLGFRMYGEQHSGDSGFFPRPVHGPGYPAHLRGRGLPPVELPLLFLRGFSRPASALRFHDAGVPGLVDDPRAGGRSEELPLLAKRKQKC